jgi:hypothetical protein
MDFLSGSTIPAFRRYISKHCLATVIFRHGINSGDRDSWPSHFNRYGCIQEVRGLLSSNRHSTVYLCLNVRSHYHQTNKQEAVLSTSAETEFFRAPWDRSAAATGWAVRLWIQMTDLYHVERAPIIWQFYIVSVQLLTALVGYCPSKESRRMFSPLGKSAVSFSQSKWCTLRSTGHLQDPLRMSSRVHCGTRRFVENRFQVHCHHVRLHSSWKANNERT